MRALALLVAVAAVAAVTLSPTPAGAGFLSGRFVDDDGSVHEPSIEAIAAEGITRGCDTDRFCPDQAITRGQMAAFLHRAFADRLEATESVGFTDVDGSIFATDIAWLGATGLTRGCDPAGTRFCPEDPVSRGQMAAFLTRALDLPATAGDWFEDDDTSVFEDAIDRLAAAGITRGCNPPADTRFCPNDVVTRAQMATFLARSLDLDPVHPRFPLSDTLPATCTKDQLECTATVSVPARSTYRIREGLYNAVPFHTGEEAALTATSTRVEVTLDGARVPLTETERTSGGGVSERWWEATITLSEGRHRIVARWFWEGELVRTTFVVVDAG